MRFGYRLAPIVTVREATSRKGEDWGLEDGGDPPGLRYGLHRQRVGVGVGRCNSGEELRSGVGAVQSRSQGFGEGLRKGGRGGLVLVRRRTC